MKKLTIGGYWLEPSEFSLEKDIKTKFKFNKEKDKK